ncbi:KH domain-containing protein HEN4 [Silene latifolia]|uniref:KH domain-containing protein HEN4 n=1 Tax=Silene latifolia TaxID=37657 RepID=UPI003D789307
MAESFQSLPSKRTLISDNNHTLSPSKRTKQQHQQPPPIPAGHASIRILCHASHIGGFIGKSGSTIKQLQLDTGSKIRVDDSLQPGSDYRVIHVLGPSVPSTRVKLRKQPGDVSEDEVEYGEDVSAVQVAALRVFEKVLEVSKEEIGSGGTTSFRVLIDESMVGYLIGKGGKTVEKLRTECGAKIKVLLGDQLPSYVSPPDDVVEVEGDLLAVKKGILGVCGRLQLCPQGDKLSNKDSKPLESTSQPTILDFRVDPLVHRAPLYVATASNPATGVRPLSFEAQRTPLYMAPMLSSSAAVSRPLSFEVHRHASMESTTQPQEVVFKMVCSNERIGGLIGRGGSIVRALQEETGAHISIGPSVTDCDERLVTITSKEEVDTRSSPAQRAVILVFSRSAEGAAEKGPDTGSDKVSSVSARLIIPSSQVGCLLGKGGTIVSEMRKATGANIRILKGEQVPKCASDGDHVVEVTGQFVKIQDALYQVTSRLRSKFFPGDTTSFSESQTNTPLSVDSSLHKRVRDLPIDIHHSSATSQSIGRLSTMRQGLNSLYNHQRLDHSPLAGSLTSEVALDARYHGGVRDLPIGVYPSVVPSQSTDGLSTMRHGVDSLYNHQRSDHSPLSGPRPSDVALDAHYHGRGTDLPIGMRHSFGNSQSIDGLSTVRHGLDSLYNHQRLNHSPLSGPRTSEVSLDASRHGRIGDLHTGLHRSFAPSQPIDGRSAMRQGVESLYYPERSDHSSLAGSRIPEVADGVNSRSFVNLGRGAPANGGAELGSGNRPPIVTNTTVEILVPEDAINSVYGENGRNLMRIRQISGAKVEVHEAPSGARDRTVLISGTPEETQAAQSLLHAFILTGSS